MPQRILHIITTPDGEVVSASDGVDEALGRDACGGRCAAVVAAWSTDGVPVCTEACAGELHGQKAHGVVESGGTAWQLVCTNVGDHHVITLLPAPPGALRTRALTRREQDVLVCLAKGWSNDRIGRQLGIRPSTVRTHVESILAKLNVPTRAGASARAVAMGLLSGEDV